MKQAEDVTIVTVANQEPSLADLAYSKIKAAIVQGELPPGFNAAEQQIAAQLQISRTPVHQAVVRLEQEGWVRLVQRKGIIISPVTAGEMRNVYEVLMALEALAVQRLASDVRDSSSNVIAQLENLATQGERALADDNLDGWADADDAFHSLLAEGCGNAELSRLARSVREKAHRARLLTRHLRPKPTASNKDHRDIVQAIRDGDSNRAKVTLESHRRRGMDTLLPIIEQLGAKRRILSA
jgi:DNA-binding GntR family transcriptional regulator